MLTHLGLFEGIGGFSLAARKMGWQTVAWCEIDKFCQQVLKYHFPRAIGHDDIKKTDFKQYANRIDVLTGGFPCQPFSTAGKLEGKNDERHLWPEMLRAIQEIKPAWIIGENVRGFVNWNAGLVFDEVQDDLENEGYEVESYILPAAGIGAPHRRERVFIIAYSHKNAKLRYRFTQNRYTEGKGESEENKRERVRNDISGNVETGAIAYGCKIGFQRQQDRRSIRKIRQKENKFPFRCNIAAWENFPTQSPVCGGNDGISYGVDGISFSKWRRESIGAFGNAVVPQLAYVIFQVIQTYYEN